MALRLDDGRLTRAWHDTFLIGEYDIASLPRDLMLRAAVASVEPGAALGGVSAIERHCGWNRFHDDIVVVSSHWHPDVPEHRIRFQRDRCEQDRIRLVGGIPTAAPLDALFQSARHLTPHQAVNALRGLEYSTSIVPDDLLRELRDRHVIGASTIRRALVLRRELSAGTKSRSEDRLLGPVTALLGEPLVNVCGSTGLGDYEPDMYWPSLRLIVEIDGDHHHSDPTVTQRDDERDRLLNRLGIQVVRVPWRDVWRDVDGVTRTIVREAGVGRDRSRCHDRAEFEGST